MARDPFTWSMEQRRKIIPDRWWYGIALIFAGIAIPLTFGGGLWIVASVACLIAGELVVARAIGRQRDRS